jgi:acetyl esterase/lipase
MRILINVLAIALIAGGLAYHFAALKIFNFLVSKDPGTTLLAEAISYGPDPRQRLDIYAPKGTNTALPILLFVNGGSWNDGSRSDYEFAGRAFAARGYLTITMDYRLLPQNQFPAFVQDVALAIAWAQREGQNFGGDPARIFAVGHSAGAYNLSLAVLDKHYLREAGANPETIRAIATLAGPFDFLPLDTRVTIDTFGGVAIPATTQPINYVSPEAPPFLLLSGTADTTVYPKNSRSLASHLRAVGAKVEAEEYEGMGHAQIMLALAKPLRRTKSPVYEDILQFFGKYN